MSILTILLALEANPSKLIKEDILYKNDSPLLRRVLFEALGSHNFWMKQVPMPWKYDYSVTLDEALDEIQKLKNREVTGNAALDFVENLMGKMIAEDAEVLRRVIIKDLRCGVSVATVNKVFPGLIPEYKVMLAGSDKKAIRYPAMAQIKYDGALVQFHMDNGRLKIVSRNNNELFVHSMFDSEALFILRDGEAITGELLYEAPNGTFEDRSTGNGIINKAIRGTISPTEADCLIFVCWDMVDTTSKIPYEERYKELQNRFKGAPGLVRMMCAGSKMVNSLEEAEEYFSEMVKFGHEGIILKNRKSVWVPKRSKDMCKFKSINENELKVVGVIEGSGKYQGMMGSLVCESADGKIRVSVGTGFSDSERISIWSGSENKSDTILDRVVTVAYNQKIQDKDTGDYSLFLPRFVRLREDKTIADTFDKFF